MRTDSYDALVGRSDELQHLTAMRKDKRKAYFVGSVGDETIGFVIIRGGRPLIMSRYCTRIAAVAIPGQGYGGYWLRRSLMPCFEKLKLFAFGWVFSQRM